MTIETIRPEYVEFVPRELEPGLLYISKRFETASHLCACGCGTKIVTPLRSAEYRLKDCDGDITVRPSIGNWDHPCQSHYLITKNKIVWAAKMSQTQIENGRLRDDVEREEYFTSVAWPWWRRAGAWIKQQVGKFFGR